MSAQGHDLTSTYVATIDAGIGAASEALRTIDPMASLAARLSALGVDDRAVWARAASGAGDAGGASGLGFALLWRFGPSGQTARVAWQIRLSEDGVGRTVLSVGIRARASDHEARSRIAAAWPIVETIALAHARGLHGACEEYAGDPLPDRAAEEAGSDARRCLERIRPGRERFVTEPSVGRRLPTEMERAGIEPATSGLQSRRSPS